MSRPRMKRPRWARVPGPSGVDPAVAARVSADDRAWFEANPGETVLWRRMVPGETVVEFAAPPRYVWLIQVTRLSPGSRLRSAHLAVEVGLS